MRRDRTLRVTLLAAAWAFLPSPGPGGSLVAQGVGRCALNIQRAGRQVERSDPEQPGAITAFVSGPVTVTCGDAVMTGDSAVWRQALEQAVMVGRVRYRDTTRTLESERLTFFGARDAAVAEGDVRLVRLSNRATLEGPRVTFTRTPFAGARTTATGRPRMTLPSGRGETGSVEPSVIDADVAEFVGEEEAFAQGDVVLERRDLRATADSARFSEAAGRAILYGDPVVDGEGYRLVGDSIVAGFELGDLRTIHSYGDATAAGERYELRADQIRARLAGDQVETIWAFGDGRSLARSAEFVLAGDSIVFAFVEGRADSVTAVGSASAVQVAADSGVQVAADSGVQVAADSGVQVAADSGAQVAADSGAQVAADSGAEVAADSGAAGSDSTAVEARPRRAGLEEPGLSTAVGSNWIAGDTVRARFAPAKSGGAGPAEPDSTAASGEEDVELEMLTATGAARSFYAAVRDTTRTGEASRNYLLGSRIEIRFREGEPQTLAGTDAIGVYLEPIAEEDGG